MFIFNMNVNLKKTYKIVCIILLIIILILFAIAAYKIFNNNAKSGCTVDKNKVVNIASTNYTNILKAVHENVDEYVGTKIRFIGFVYRLNDFSSEQFVLAREMIISSDFQAVTVGFLCHMNGANKYKDGCWIQVEGKITKGDYHGEIPVIEIYKINETCAPSDEYVYPPSESYIPTAGQI